jgi:hypothetical protein
VRQVFPLTHPRDWCGEFQPAPPPARPPFEAFIAGLSVRHRNVLRSEGFSGWEVLLADAAGPGG